MAFVCTHMKTRENKKCKKIWFWWCHRFIIILHFLCVFLTLKSLLNLTLSSVIWPIIHFVMGNNSRSHSNYLEIFKCVCTLDRWYIWIVMMPCYFLILFSFPYSLKQLNIGDSAFYLPLEIKAYPENNHFSKKGRHDMSETDPMLWGVASTCYKCNQFGQTWVAHAYAMAPFWNWAGG